MLPSTAVRSSRPARLAIVAIAAAVAVALFLVPSRSRPRSTTPCTRAIAAGDPTVALATCAGAYARSGSDRDLVLVAHAFLMRGDRQRAAAIARRLLDGPMYGDGHRVLSQVMVRDGAPERARQHATVAYVAHLLTRDEPRMMRDALSVSQTAWKIGDYATALAAADEAIRLAQHGGDRSTEVHAYIARADALRRMGDRGEAAAALQHALARAITPCDQAWSHLKTSMLHGENAASGFARLALDEAAAANQACGSKAITGSVAQNRAWLLRADDPAAAEAILDGFVATRGESVETYFMRGVIAGNRGDRRAAAAYLEQARRGDPPDADWRWEIEQARAEVAELRGDALGELRAEQIYRSSIAMVTTLRATAQGRSAFLVASHRAPYDGLIALLARQGRWRDVIAVVLELDASDMLRATAAAGSDERVPMLTGPAPVAAVAVPSVDAVIAAWRGRDLVIVLAPTERLIRPGHERVVRVRVVDGAVTGERLGLAAAARTAADDLFGDPDHVGAARTLGAVIVPADGRRDTLDVLAIDRLGKVPLAALRDGSGALVMARRPLARVLAIRPRGAPPPTAAHAVVIADPLGDLWSARLEGRVVATLLAPDATLSGAGAAPAIRVRLEDARDASVLHVAAHVADRGRWRALRLLDRDVSPADIVSLGLAPRLAVLASCGSAAARDDEGWGSIAAALLDSGTAAVIATDRSVGDAASFAVVRGFYAQPDWRDDPARALARVQVELARRGGPAPTWAFFGVLRGPP